MEDSLTGPEALAEVVAEFENSEQTTRPAREKSELCRDYFDDKQLTTDERKALDDRGQPAVIFNEIKPKVKTMLGLEKQTRKDPKAFPRNPDDEEASRAATDSIRYVCDAERWDDKRSHAAKNLAIEGTGIVKVGFKARKGGRDPSIVRVAWDRFYYDPQSSEEDFTDAGYMGEVIWMDLGDAKRMFGDREDILDATWRSTAGSETYDDKPKWQLWSDYKRRRIRICEHYYKRGGKWLYCIFTKAGFLVEPQPSPYHDDEGEPECPLKAVSLYVDRDNNRYGEVQSMLSPQDEINKRRSKSLHIVNTRQLRVSPAVASDPKDVRKELARPDGVFIGEVGDVEILSTADMLAGNMQLEMGAREHIHRTGANSALAGKDVTSQSGRAILAQQQGGMTESADYLDRIRVLSLMVYRSVWARIRQCWDAERWIRVTDDQMNVRFVGLNQPVTALQQMAKQMGVTKDNMNEAPPEIAQRLQMMAQHPMAGQVVAIENNVAQLDVDIIIDEGVDTPTIQAEQFDVVAKMLPAAPPNLQPLLWEALIRNSAFRDKDKVLEALSKPAPPSPEQQQMQQLQLAGAQAEVEKTQSETVKNIADAQAKQAGVVQGAMETGFKQGMAA